MSDFNQSKYINDFIKETYDTIKVQVPKGKREIIKKHANQKGYKSVNAYINSLIKCDMEITQPPVEQNISITNNHGVVMRDNHGEIKISEQTEKKKQNLKQSKQEYL